MRKMAESRKQILVVEDEGLIAAELQSRLERLGYAVPEVVGSGAQALAAARRHHLDLILMDIRLKGELDGIATAAELKKFTDTPLVYVTAHADQDTINRAKFTEPYGYILKPIADGDLHSTVQISLYRHQMERRLRQSQARLATTLASIGDGVIGTSSAGEIVFMNPVAERLTGHTMTDAEGRLLMEVLELYDESTRLPMENPVPAMLRSSPAGSAEPRVCRLANPSGSVTLVELECFANPDEAPLGAILVLRDVAARRDLQQRLTQLQRMEAIANLAGGLAHDFNNQLTVILGRAEQLCEDLTGEDQHSAAEIRQAALIASATTKQLSTLSRREMGNTDVVNLNEVVVELDDTLRHTLGEGRHLELNLFGEAGMVRCDREQLRQVLLNLCLNARDAMPKGGTLRIETSPAEVRTDIPEARVYRPGPYVKLIVADTGRGMDQGTLSRVFEPFFTTKRASVGTGLGLSVVHSIVMQNGGYITAASELGCGTTFEILFPRVAARPAEPRRGASRGAVGGPASLTVLIVEDEDGVRRLMHNYFEREGYQLLEAQNAEQAEVIAEVYDDTIHIMVTDVFMPGMTGPELARRLMPLRPEMKVLFVSGYPLETLFHNGILEPGQNYLAKPFTAPELLRSVHQVLASAATV